MVPAGLVVVVFFDGRTNFLTILDVIRDDSYRDWQVGPLTLFYYFDVIQIQLIDQNDRLIKYFLVSFGELAELLNKVQHFGHVS